MYVNGAAGPKSSGSAPSSIHLPTHQHDISCYSRSAWLLVILLGKVSHVEMLSLGILLTTLQFCLSSERINLLRILINQKIFFTNTHQSGKCLSVFRRQRRWAV